MIKKLFLAIFISILALSSSSLMASAYNVPGIDEGSPDPQPSSTNCDSLTQRGFCTDNGYACYQTHALRACILPLDRAPSGQLPSNIAGVNDFCKISHRTQNNIQSRNDDDAKINDFCNDRTTNLVPIIIRDDSPNDSGSNNSGGSNSSSGSNNSGGSNSSGGSNNSGGSNSSSGSNNSGGSNSSSGSNYSGSGIQEPTPAPNTSDTIISCDLLTQRGRCVTNGNTCYRAGVLKACLLPLSQYPTGQFPAEIPGVDSFCRIIEYTRSNIPSQSDDEAMINQFCSEGTSLAPYRDSTPVDPPFDPDTYTPTTAETFTGNCRFLLGLTSWDCGVDITDEDSLVFGIWQIALNVLTNISVIAAYLILGYVIYGGYQYIFSGGSADKIANGKKIITRAFIGLAIVSLANVIMNTIRFILIGTGGKDNNYLNCVQAGSCVEPGTLITNSIQWVVGVAGVVAVIFLIYGGITFMTSTGDPSKVKKGKDMITYSVIGLIVVALAEIITAFISNIINNAS